MRLPTLLSLIVFWSADFSVGQTRLLPDGAQPALSQVTPIASPLGSRATAQWAAMDDLLHRIWSRKISLDVAEAPLEEVLQTLADTLECQLRIDRISLADTGLKPDRSVTIDVSELTVGSLLDAILQEDDLAYIVEPGRLLITTSDQAEDQQYHHARYYPVGTWLADASGEFDIEAVKQAVALIEPISWKALHGPGAMEVLHDGLIVWQTATRHYRIHRLLSAVAAAKALPDEAYEVASFSIHPLGRSADTIREKLRQTMLRVEWESITVAELAQFIEEQVQIEVLIHEAALEDIGYSPDTPLSGRWQNVTAENLLNDLMSRNLAWQVRGDFLEITTEEEKERNLDIRIYPVRDLIAGVGDLDPTAAKSRMGAGWCGSVMPRSPKLPEKLQLSSPPDRLIDRFKTVVYPAEWHSQGGISEAISSHSAECLVVSHVPEAHQQIETLLDQFRQHPEFDLRDAYEREAAEVIVTTYPTPRDARGQPQFNPSDLVQLASRVRQIAPSTWKDERHYIEPLGGQLLVSQRRDVQREVYRYLKEAGFIVDQQQNASAQVMN